MKNRLKIFARAALLLPLCSFAVYAQEADSSLIAEQKAVLNSLDSIENNSLGFALGGRAKSGFFGSVIDSKALPKEEAQTEYSAFTDFLLSLSIRPSSETRALFDLRFHKDWQSAYREGNNPPIISWWSYDGSILDKKLKFNLGTMRVNYTPLTMATPNPDFIFEPHIFAEQRAEAMADRYLDNSGKRLLQGLNFEFNSPIAFIDNLHFQGTLARLRNNAKKLDQVFFDFDPLRDRYAAAVGIGLEVYGFSIGVSDVYSFDRVKSARVKSTVYAVDSIDQEFNNVLSFKGGIDSKKWSLGSVRFGANAELAISNWMHYRDYIEYKQDTLISLITPNQNVSLPCANCSDAIQGGTRYPYYQIKNYFEYRNEKVEDLHNQLGFLADAFVEFSKSEFEAKLSGHYLKTDYGFESELAASPSYLPSLPILNSNSVFESGNFDDVIENFRSGSLENLYYALYYTLPLNAATIISGDKGTPSVSASDQLLNNYKLGQYYRNAYSYRAYTRLEKDGISENLDPSVNMALPYGYATPDRNGGDADLLIKWNDAVMLRGVFGSYSSDSSGDYTRFGGGLSVKVGRLANLSKPIDISGSFEQSKEKNGAEREAVRIMAGLNLGIWRGLSLEGGVQILEKKFGIPYGGIVDKTSEMLAIGGPRIKIGEKSSFVLQGGLLSNSISAVSGEKLDINKYVGSALLSVRF